MGNYWKLRRVLVKGFGFSIQAWSQSRHKWLHLRWER